MRTALALNALVLCAAPVQAEPIPEGQPSGERLRSTQRGRIRDRRGSALRRHRVHVLLHPPHRLS